MTERQRRFVAEYVVTGNAAKSYIAAGYSAKHAETHGPRLAGNGEVAAAIADARAKLQIRTEITQDRVLKEAALLAFSDVTHYIVDESGNLALAPGAPPDAMRAVSSVKRRVTTKGAGETAERVYEVEFRLWDKPGMVHKLGRHVGLFPDKVEVRGLEGLNALASVLGRALDRASGREPSANGTPSAALPGAATLPPAKG